MSSLALCSSVLSAAWQPAAALLPAGAAAVRREVRPRMQSEEEARREKLRQLFGDQTAESLAPLSKRERAETTQQALDMMMLEEGIQGLEWGTTRLVDVDMAPGPLEATLEPLIEGSQLLCLRLDLPLGMLLEESEAADGRPGAPAVVELFDVGSAITSGVRKGDVVRATTACKMQMATPTWQLMLGGIGRPTMQKMIYVTDDQPFETVLAAISSNSREQQGNGQIVLLLERRPGDDF
mmetsp:Transcript_66223/g.181556  ORF Transcript_66223/g.181556 Transcript_66223/m.181556 type:complete len:238 (+) Transcript_66223:88-801(+)